MRNVVKVVVGLGVVGGLALGVLTARSDAPSADAVPSATVAHAAPAAAADGAPLAATTGAPVEVVVYKSPTCGCCARWVDHMRAAGFAVVAHDTSDMTAVKRRLGVPSTMESCHTAVVDGFVIEGHVPAADVRTLLERRPAVAGLAVPGMPMGSPGMEGSRTDRYDVLTFDSTGRRTVFSSH